MGEKGWLADSLGKGKPKGKGRGRGGRRGGAGASQVFSEIIVFVNQPPPHVAYASKNVLAFEEWAIQARKCPQGRYTVSLVILWGDGGHEVMALSENMSSGDPFFKCQHV